MSSYSREQLEAWLKTIPAKGKVLDIGGSQNPIKGRTGSWEVEEYKILDLEIPHEVKKDPDIIADLNEVQFITGEYDQVFCIEVAEYWYNPVVALDNIANLIKSGGELFISFHFIYPHHNPIKLDYLRYTKWGVEKLMKESGFRIAENQPKYFKSPYLSIRAFYSGEGMRGINKNIDEIHNEQGWLIKAIKI